MTDTIDSPYKAVRVVAGIPIWTIFAYGQDIGCATLFDYDDEGPMATVRYGEDDTPVTFDGESIRNVLDKVGAHLRLIDIESLALADAEYYNEEIAPLIAAERAAENAYRGGEEDPIW